MEFSRKSVDAQSFEGIHLSITDGPWVDSLWPKVDPPSSQRRGGMTINLRNPQRLGWPPSEQHQHAVESVEDQDDREAVASQSV